MAGTVVGHDKESWVGTLRCRLWPPRQHTVPHLIEQSLKRVEVKHQQPWLYENNGVARLIPVEGQTPRRHRLSGSGPRR